MKIHYSLSAAAALISMLAVISCGQRQNGKDSESRKTPAAAVSTDASTTKSTDTLMVKENENPLYEIHTSEGTITVMLYNETPRHRDNFAKLAESGFYDGILFHRIIPGFMIQVGDPFTKDPSNAEKIGAGGPGYTIPAEILPEFSHKKGALAAARIGDTANPKRESSGSQFYIVQDEEGCRHLDGQYTIFGETVDGLEVIDRIAGIPTDYRDRPVKDVKIISVTKVE